MALVSVPPPLAGGRHWNGRIGERNVGMNPHLKDRRGF